VVIPSKFAAGFKSTRCISESNLGRPHDRRACMIPQACMIPDAVT
jgi:hypothetical protein